MVSPKAKDNRTPEENERIVLRKRVKESEEESCLLQKRLLGTPSFLHIALILYLCRFARIISTFVPLSALPVLKYQPPFQAP